MPINVKPFLNRSKKTENHPKISPHAFSRAETLENYLRMIR